MCQTSPDVGHEETSGDDLQINIPSARSFLRLSDVVCARGRVGALEPFAFQDDMFQAVRHGVLRVRRAVCCAVGDRVTVSAALCARQARDDFHEARRIDVDLEEGEAQGMAPQR